MLAEKRTEKDGGTNMTQQSPCSHNVAIRGGCGSARKRLTGKHGLDSLHGVKPAAIPNSGKIPAVRLTTTNNTTPPTLISEDSVCSKLKKKEFAGASMSKLTKSQ